MGIKIEIRNPERLKNQIRLIGTLIKDWKEPLTNIRNDFWNEERAIFESEGSAGNRSKWAALSAKYAATKAKKFPGKTILRATDKLFNQMTGGGFSAITSTSMFAGTKLPYAVFHQLGTSKMPARKLIRITGEQKSRYTNIVNDYVMKFATEKGIRIVRISR